jgi:flagellar biogenesis protein FliO
VSDLLVTMRAVLSFAAVLAVLAAFVWALRRGSLRLSRFAPRGAVAVETAVSLGERRSLAIIAVEGRRMLIGLTPASVSLITDLGPAPATTPADSEPKR